jgi:hypothetical protein
MAEYEELESFMPSHCSSKLQDNFRKLFFFPTPTKET